MMRYRGKRRKDFRGRTEGLAALKQASLSYIWVDLGIWSEFQIDAVGILNLKAID
ncbi:MAG: hypothetical protein ACK2T3_04800 [Candidatus Promineifilaceae bacterium]